VGRSIASVPGYRYSSALRSLSGDWSAEQLSRFLEDPEAFAPGTTMKTEGIKDEQARRQLIEYLATRGQ
jgi:cytochrome c